MANSTPPPPRPVPKLELGNAEAFQLGKEGESPRPGDDNPFAAPSLAALAPADVEDRDLDSLAGIRRALVKTRTWIMGISIFGFIAGVWMLLGTAAGLFFMRIDETTTIPVMMVVLTLAIGALMLALSLLLWAYAARIKRFRDTLSTTALQRALESQTAFWRLTGISIIATIGLYVAVIFLAVNEFSNMQWEASERITTTTEVTTEPAPSTNDER